MLHRCMRKIDYAIIAHLINNMELKKVLHVLAFYMRL